MVKKDYVIFIIIPIISFILMLAYVGFQIWNYKQFSYNENGRYVIKSIIDLSNLKEILRYVYLNLGENITRINSIFDKYSMIIYLVIPAMFFYKITKKRKKRYLGFILFIVLSIFIVVSVAAFYTDSALNSYFLKIFSTMIYVFTALISSYLYSLLYISLIENYRKTLSSLFTRIEKVHQIKIKLFIIIFIMTLIQKIEIYLGIFIQNYEITFANTYNLINIFISIYSVVLIPRLVLFNNGILVEIRETNKFLINNIDSIIKILIYYTLIYFITYYILGSVRIEHSYPGAINIFDNIIRFIILFPISIYTFFGFNYRIIETSLKELNIIETYKIENYYPESNN